MKVETSAPTRSWRAAVPFVLGVGIVLTLLALPAAAQTSLIQQAAEELAGDPVFVHPEADPAPTAAEAERLRDRIRGGPAGPVYVAVLPETALDEAGGSREQALLTLGQSLDRQGTYVLVAGRTLTVNSTEGTPFGAGGAAPIGEAAIEANQGASVGTVLLDVVERLEVEAQGGDGTGNGSGGGSLVFPVVMLGLLAFGGLFVFRRARQRREDEQRQVTEVRAAVLEDLAALDRGIRDLDQDLQLVDEAPEVKRDHLTALESYAEASAAVDRVRRVDDFATATAAIEEGQYAVASARARFEGHEPPERRVPCFFDPRHGPSVADVSWAPPGGQPREVPVCAADAARIADGEEPIGRQITVDGERRPYWDAPGYWGPWAGGYYGANIGFLQGMLLGSWFAGGWGWGGADGVPDASGGDGGMFGGGDGGFGGFGDGGFGGGGFGGGDF